MGITRIKHETGAVMGIDSNDLDYWRERGWDIDDGPEPEPTPAPAPAEPQPNPGTASLGEIILPADFDPAQRASALRAYKKIAAGKTGSLTKAEREIAVKAGFLTE